MLWVPVVVCLFVVYSKRSSFIPRLPGDKRKAIQQRLHCLGEVSCLNTQKLIILVTKQKTLCAILLDRFLLLKWLPECNVNAKFVGACDIWRLNTAFGKNKSAMYCNVWSKLPWLSKVFYLPTYPPSEGQVAYLAITILVANNCCFLVVAARWCLKQSALIPAMAAEFDMYYLRLLVTAIFSSRANR